MSTITDPPVEPAAAPDGELFDGKKYDLPIPQKDGHKADTLRVAVGGGIDLDLYDQRALDFADSLKLGRDIELTVTFKVAGSSWRHTVKGEDEIESTVHTIALKAHTLRIAD